MDARQEAEQVCEGHGCPLQTCHESYEEYPDRGFGKREAGGKASAGRMPSSQERKDNLKPNGLRRSGLGVPD